MCRYNVSNVLSSATVSLKLGFGPIHQSWKLSKTMCVQSTWLGVSCSCRNLLHRSRNSATWGTESCATASTSRYFLAKPTKSRLPVAILRHGRRVQDGGSRVSGPAEQMRAAEHVGGLGNL